MSVEQIVSTYIGQIELVEADYIPRDDYGGSDLACLTLRIPKSMLIDYQKLKGQSRKLPDAEEFWRETGLADKLRDSALYKQEKHEPVADILDFLESNVTASYQYIKDQEKIHLTIIESPLG